MFVWSRDFVSLITVLYVFTGSGVFLVYEEGWGVTSWFFNLILFYLFTKLHIFVLEPVFTKTANLKI